MKRLLFFFLLIITGFAYGQNPIATKELRVHPRTDSVTVSNIGKIGFDADDDKFRFNDGTGWFSYLKEGATLPYWPLSGSATITGNTTIAGGGFNFSISGLGVTSFGSASSIALTFTGSPISSFVANTTNTLMVRGVSPTQQAIRINNTHILIQDDLADVGLVGSKDYSANYNDSSYVQKLYVDGLVSGAAFWPLTGTGTQTGDVVIDGNGNDLKFSPDSLKLNTTIVQSHDLAPAPGKKTETFWLDHTIIASVSPINTNVNRDVFGSFENAIATMTFVIHAISDDGTVGYSCEKKATFRKEGTNAPVALGAVTTIFEHEDVAGTATATTVDGNEIRLTVTTPASTSLHWTAHATILLTQYE